MNDTPHPFKVVAADRTFHAIAPSAEMARKLVILNFPEIAGIEMVVSEIDPTKMEKMNDD
jgi:hypothetical protein